MHKHHRPLPSSPRSSFNNPVTDTIRMGSDDWSDALTGMFAVCDYMHVHHPEAILPEWEYRPGAGLHTAADLDDEDYPMAVLIEWGPTKEELVYTGKILNRYTDWLRLHGRNY